MSILVDQSTRVLVQGITGGEARRHVPLMRGYGTNLVAGVSPGKGGQAVEGIPVYDTVRAALCAHEVDLAALFVPAPHVREAALEAVEAGVATIHVLAEGVPMHDAAEVVARARKKGVRIIGPGSQGVISPGRAKVGGVGGNIPDLMYRPGPVGVVSRSGGMGAEVCMFLSKAGIGQSTYVAIGGDLIIGTAFVETLELFERDPETRAVVLFCEPGTGREEAAAEFVEEGGFTKPLVALVPGEFLEGREDPVSLPHTGALIERGVGLPSRKKARLREAGAFVAEEFREIVPLVREALRRGGG